MNAATLAAVDALRQSRDRAIARAIREIEQRYGDLINAILASEQPKEPNP